MREDDRMAAWLASISPSDHTVTCAIARGEILFGLARLPPGRRRTELEEKAAKVLGAIPCEAVSVAAGERYASLKVVQQRRGLSLDENDLWIAATALALECHVRQPG
jgi:predicted nucleic acid-binding protein